MATRVRRFLVFQAFLCWQGGFVFYAAVVVPTGTDRLGAFGQGLVTQRVTDWLAVIGFGWHLLFAWDLLAEPDPNRRRARRRFAGWLVSLMFLLALVGVHIQMDDLIERDALRDSVAFRRWHMVYLWGVTVQWALALAQAWMTLGTWTATGTPSAPPPAP